MIDLGPPPKIARPALILPKPAEIIRPGDPRFAIPDAASFLPGMAGVAGFGGAGAVGFTVLNSAQFVAASSQYLSRTQSAPTNNLMWTLSVMMYRSTSSNDALFSGFGGSNPNTTFDFSASGSSGAGDYINMLISELGTRPWVSQNQYATTGAFAHWCFQYDSANATQADRLKVFLNQSQIAAGTATIALNQATDINHSGATFRIGLGSVGFGNASDYFNGLYAQFAFIDGSIVSPGSFATGTAAKDLSALSFGNNGFWQKYENSGNLGLDSSGNGNDFTNNNSVTQSSTVP